MTDQKNSTRKIDPEKVTAERLNGYAALFGCFALIGAYATTGQIIPGFVWFLLFESTVKQIISGE